MMSDPAPDGFEVWSVAADGVTSFPMTICDSYGEAWECGLEMVEEEYPTFFVAPIWRRPPTKRALNVRYTEMLMKRVEAQDDMNPNLLDRIERFFYRPVK